MFVGVDIGGTFTDFISYENGVFSIHKQLSTPQDPSQAMLEGLQSISHHQIEKIRQVAHGTTVATNAILERKGAKIALITTKGFRDLLYIGRQDRPDLYALYPQIPPPLIPRELCFEAPERFDYQGELIEKLDIQAVDRVLKKVISEGVEAIAVCLLFSYVNPIHERMIQQRAMQTRKFEAWQIILSSDVLPEFREYERASTVSLEAYVRPMMTRYTRRLRESLPKETGLRIMKSDGGVMNVERISQQAIQTALSGPAAGVIGAFHVAKQAGFDHIITLDMGGTSTDVALCAGRLQQRPESEIDNLPLRIRLLDIETIGAGGGSIARIDAGGALRVGPESAGANPGPMIYGMGGEQITISDANALLGRLDADHFLGGKMTLHLDSAREAIEKMANQLKMETSQLAHGILQVANSNIERILRRVSIERGHDPRDFTLVAFGGAGALHACEVAERLQIKQVLIPQYPGVLCAMGLLFADVVTDSSASILLKTQDAEESLQQAKSQLVGEAVQTLTEEGIPSGNQVFSVTLDVRYVGQAHELNLVYADGDDIAQKFHDLHRDTYGHALEREVEIVNLRVRGIGQIEKPTLSASEFESDSPEAGFMGEKQTIFGMMKLYEREQLPIGAKIEGETLLFQFDSTIYIPKSWRGEVDAYRNLVLSYEDWV